MDPAFLNDVSAEIPARPNQRRLGPDDSVDGQHTPEDFAYGKKRISKKISK